jgi:flavin-dependent dehydrogenase
LNIAAAFDSSFVRECRGPGVAACRILDQVNWPRIPGLADRLWKGTAKMTRTIQYSSLERVLAIGDAAGYVEPFTGEGISWAVESAIRVTRLLKNSWYANLPLRWARWNRNESIQRRRLIRSVAWVLRRPQLTAVSINLLNLFPSITGRLIKHLFNPDSIVLPPLSSRAQTPAPHTAAVSCI